MRVDNTGENKQCLWPDLDGESFVRRHRGNEIHKGKLLQLTIPGRGEHLGDNGGENKRWSVFFTMWEVASYMDGRFRLQT